MYTENDYAYNVKHERPFTPQQAAGALTVRREHVPLSENLRRAWGKPSPLPRGASAQGMGGALPFAARGLCAGRGVSSALCRAGPGAARLSLRRGRACPRASRKFSFNGSATNGFSRVPAASCGGSHREERTRAVIGKPAQGVGQAQPFACHILQPGSRTSTMCLGRMPRASWTW